MKKIILTNGGFALVDKDDYDFINNWKWRMCKRRHITYAVRQPPKVGNNKTIYMHRLIMNVLDPNVFIDHKDGDGLFNSRLNLRIANRSQNGANRKKTLVKSSTYLGVRRKGVAWVASVSKNGKDKHIGYFKEEKEAALAYNAAAQKIHGDFASLNKV